MTWLWWVLLAYLVPVAWLGLEMWRAPLWENGYDESDNDKYNELP